MEPNCDIRRLGPDAGADVPRYQAHRERVFDALVSEDDGLSINDIVAHCGGSPSAVSRSLVMLEAQGRARFSGGRWAICFRPPAFDAVAGAR